LSPVSAILLQLDHQYTPSEEDREGRDHRVTFGASSPHCFKSRTR
jgi:hypothetical protein